MSGAVDVSALKRVDLRRSLAVVARAGGHSEAWAQEKQVRVWQQEEQHARLRHSATAYT